LLAETQDIFNKHPVCYLNLSIVLNDLAVRAALEIKEKGRDKILDPFQLERF
jgi:hypothetical protein